MCVCVWIPLEAMVSEYQTCFGFLCGSSGYRGKNLLLHREPPDDIFNFEEESHTSKYYEGCGWRKGCET